jgi:hypothetical protein
LQRRIKTFYRKVVKAQRIAKQKQLSALASSR